MLTSTLIWAILFGVIGCGYIRYASSQKKGMALVCGFALCIIPYFISSILILIIVGIALVLLPIFLRF